jgi:hypothetical protein
MMIKSVKISPLQIQNLGVLKMVAQNNECMSSAIESLYLSNTDENIRKVARDHEDFLRYQAKREETIKELTDENATLKDENARLR